MNTTINIEIPAGREALVRQVLALADEFEQLALSAPEGSVLEVCELAVLQRGRQLNADMLAQAVARRIEAAEKKGRRSAGVAVVAPKKIVAQNVGNS